VNVLSDLKVRDTLGLMKRSPETTLDRTIASEIAIRDGARAVILPTVAEVGGRVRVSAEVIDPHTQTTVYAESADGVGAESTLGSIDQVTSELREKLGEAIASIDRDSEPLPKVSTDNLDALKAYSLGLKAHFDFKPKEAISFFQRAVEIDPDFALAYLAAGRTYGRIGDVPAIRREFDKANAHRAHLAPREQLTLDAQLARFGPVEPMLQRWRQLIEMYPDNHDAHFILAIELMLRANRFEEGLSHAQTASAPQNPYRDNAMALQGMLLTGMDRIDESLKVFDTTYRSGFKGSGFDYAKAYAAKRDFKNAERVVRGSTGTDTGDLSRPLQGMLFALDQGDLKAATLQAEKGVRASTKAEPLFAAPTWQIRALTLDAIVRSESDEALARKLLAQLSSVKAKSDGTDRVAANFSEILALSIGYVGADIGSRSVVDAALAQVESSKDIAGFPLMEQLREALRAESERLAGKPQDAVARLDDLAKSDSALGAVHVALARAARDAGQDRIALREWRWIASHRGRAYMEWAAEDALAPAGIADTTLAHLEIAELLAKDGDSDAARKELAVFLAAWPLETLPPHLRRRVDVVRGQSA
jgi:putative peptide modification system cyclase